MKREKMGGQNKGWDALAGEPSRTTFAETPQQKEAQDHPNPACESRKIQRLAQLFCGRNLLFSPCGTMMFLATAIMPFEMEYFQKRNDCIDLSR